MIIHSPPKWAVKHKNPCKGNRIVKYYGNYLLWASQLSNSNQATYIPTMLTSLTATSTDDIYFTNPSMVPTLYHHIDPAQDHTVRRITTKAGYTITIDDDGNYEITAPENLQVEDLIRAHPTAKLLDSQGRVLEFNPDGSFRLETLENASHHVIDIKSPLTRIKDSIAANSFGRIAIPNNGLCRLLLPDGVELIVHSDGSYEINETKKTWTYRAAPRNFNKYLNASDVVEDFIRYLGSLDVRQRHVMSMPLGLFLKFIIIEAAKADGDPYEDVEPPLLEGVKQVKAQPRCRFCQRYISQARADKGVYFCSPPHMQRFLLREGLNEPVRLRSRKSSIARPPSDSYLVPMAAASHSDGS